MNTVFYVVTTSGQVIPKKQLTDDDYGNRDTAVILMIDGEDHQIWKPGCDWKPA